MSVPNELPVDAYRLVPADRWIRIVATLQAVAALPESNGYACPVCGGALVYSKTDLPGASASRVDHTDDCPWVAARVLLDDLGESRDESDD